MNAYWSMNGPVCDTFLALNAFILIHGNSPVLVQPRSHFECKNKNEMKAIYIYFHNKFSSSV